MERTSFKIGRYNRPSEYPDFIIHKDIKVPMRDGVRLATDVYLPAKNGTAVDGKFPTIMIRTPYNKSGNQGFPSNIKEFVTKGYVFVIQDVRGRFGSEGEFYIYVNEGRDGYDAVEWVAKQPWSNGMVGTTGWSYMGTDQDALARENPPHLKAMFVGCGSSNYHQDVEGQNGAFKLSHNLNYTFTLARAERKVREDPALQQWLAECDENIWDWFKRPLSKHVAIFKDLPNVQKWYRDWVDHQDYDEYWKQEGYNVEGFYGRYPDIPTYYFGGWSYHSFRSAIKSYEELSKLHKSPTFLMIGPWPEGPAGDLLGQKTWHGDVDFGTDVQVHWDEIRFRFFDQFLKGIDTGILNEPPVKVFTMGGGDGRRRGYFGKMSHSGRWRAETTWPLPHTAFTKYYLHGDGTLRPDLPSPRAAPSNYSFDPQNPVPQIGGNFMFPFSDENMGPYDQKCNRNIPGCEDNLPLSSRSDVLVFATPPLKEDVEVTGPLVVKLWASSSAVDTDFTAKLIDVYPSNADSPHGYAMWLVDSIIRARYRESFEKQKLMVPGQIYEFTIDLWATSNLFRAGHQLRLDISSSNYPLFDVNPNTGEKIGYHTKTIIADNTLYHDAEHPSHILLPLIP